MRTLLHAVIAASVVALALPSPAAAQDPAPPAAKKMAPTVEAIVSALDRTAASLKAFEAKKELAPENVQVVVVDEVLAPEAAAASFDEALKRNSEVLTRLRTALGKHQVVAGVLEESELTPEQIVAVDLPETGDIVIYVRKGA